MEQPEQPGQRPAEFQIQIPPDLEVGTFADFMTVWHTAHDFTLDFAVMQQTQPPENPADRTSPFKVPCRVVARVKIPPTLVYDIMRALNENLTGYEGIFGEIQRPGPQQEEPQ